MLPLCMSRARMRLGRVSLSILRMQTRKFNSTNGSSSSAKIYTAIAGGAISIPGVWWMITTRDDVPDLGSAPTDELVFNPGHSKDQVTRLISEDAYSFSVRNVAGVSRYDGTQLASNSPCEDRFIHGKFPSPWNDGNEWMAWAVFDGHAGWQTADLLQNQLLPFVQHSLSKTKSLSDKESVPDESVQRGITRAFTNLDDSIINSALATSQSNELSFQEKVKKLAPAWAGSCALLSIYDPVTSTLHVACTGDSRALLGQKDPDGKWEAIPLSIDQTGSNKGEIARIYKEHPGEENIVKGGRVLGLMVSRAFGDSRWKWPLEFQQEIKRRFEGPAPLTPKYDVRTPPYITVEPVVTSTKIDPRKPSFLIMATDGIWDVLSNQQGVDLVGKWLESQGAEKGNSIPEPTYDSFDFGQFSKGVSWKFVEGRTTIQDDNVAVHLVRNALGGNHDELIAGRLAFSSPFSRQVRDDMTVQVVFFGGSNPQK